MLRKKYTFPLLTLLISVLFAGCSKEYDEAEYNNAYDTLLTRYTSIDSLSHGLKVSIEKLVGTRFGVYEADEDLVKDLNKLNEAYAEGDMDEVEDIYDDASDYEFTAKGHKVSVSEYEEIVVGRNENFSNGLPDIVEEHFATILSKTLEDKYSIWSLPKNVYTYLFKSKEEIAKENYELITGIANNKTVKAYYLNKTKAYESLIVKEKKVLFNAEPEYNSFKDLALDQIEIGLSDSAKNAMYNRLQLDFEDLASKFFWDVIIAIILYVVIWYITKKLCAAAAEEEWANFKCGYRKGDGFLKNALRITANVVATALDVSEKQQEIKDKWNGYKRKIQFVLLILELVVGNYVIANPEIKAEAEIQEELVGEYHKALQAIDLPMLEYYNYITLNS
jgi:hypothetical protein